MLEGSHSHWRERAAHSRPTDHLFRQLTFAYKIVAASLSILTSGCDLGEPDPPRTRGPDLHVVATSPRPGQGLECEINQIGCEGVPTNTPIEIAFDRYLWPAGAPTRQSIIVYSGNRANPGPFLEPEYDVVGRVLTFRLAAGQSYAPATLYTVELVQPTEEVGGFGLRAFDGAPLRPGPVPLTFSFFTASTPATTEPDVARSPSCDDVLGILQLCRGCHGDSEMGAAMGLRFDDRLQLLKTAIGQVAHNADIGPRTGAVLENPPRVGVGMPRIDPSAPGNSFLLYKLVRNPDNFQNPDAECIERAGRFGLAPELHCGAADPAENERLREWFVRGSPMPLELPVDGGSIAIPLTRSRLVDIQRWIAAGAPCP